jgi:DNA-binding NarL/FixJ family response regulator
MRLVLVDDDSQSRRVLRKLIERSTSFEIVGEASDGAEAVSLVAELQPDVVIMDMHMPVMDGAAATREIKRSAPKVHVLACSAGDSPEAREAMRQAGVSGFVRKEDSDELLYELELRTMADPSVSTDRSGTGGDPVTPG